MKIYPVLFLMLTASTVFGAVPAHRLIKDPVPRETVDGQIQVEFDHGTNTRVEIMTRQQAEVFIKKLWVTLYAFDPMVQISTMTTSYAKPAAR